MTNQKVLLVSIMTVVAMGLLILGSSILIENVQAQLYNYDPKTDQYTGFPDSRKNYADVTIQDINCFNSNININGIDVTQIPQDDANNDIPAAEATGTSHGLVDTNTQNGNGLKDRTNFDGNHVNICINNNLNRQINNSCENCPNGIPFTLMTWNIYLGASLTPIFVATTPQEFVAAVGSAYNRIQASNFTERANSIADEIQETHPDLIGLQEVSLLRTQSPSDGLRTLATNVSSDYLQLLIDVLAARGLIYEPIVVQTAFDSEVPGLINGSLADIRLTDREVILASADRDFTLSNIQGARFAANFTITTALGPFSIPRAWVSVDVTFDHGDKARIVSTHLEPILHPQLSPIIQGLQADELINGPANTNLPVVILGDFNSNADGTGTPTYSKMINADFIDTWNKAGEGAGFTCCQAENLLNPNSSLGERIDFMFFKGTFDVKDIELVGNQQNDRTISGLWPSDHAGVVANLNLNK
jgi:endonuclease/exonuclease/phosphatase family metal-dependent hydrolase